MNWVKANKFLTGFIVVMLIGVGILGYEVFAAAGENDEATNAYTAKAGDFNRLRRGTPFPDKANLAQYEVQKKDAAKVISEFQVDLSKQEFPLVPLSPERFQDKLKAMVTEVRKKAEEASVKLPDKFFLGFEKYEGAPPTPEAAPLLGRQLDAINWVVDQYIDSHVLEVASLIRSELPEEKGGGGRTTGRSGGGQRPSGGGGGPRPSGGAAGGAGGGGASRRDLVHYYPFDIVTICSQEDLNKILNTITGTQAPQFYVVRQLRIRNQNEKGPAKSTPSPADPNKPEGAKYILGEEKIEVVARIDMVDFTPPTDAAGETEKDKATPAPKQP